MACTCGSKGAGTVCTCGGTPSAASTSRVLTRRSESWMLVERYVEHYPHDWRLIFKRGDEVLEVSVSEEVWRAFDA